MRCVYVCAVHCCNGAAVAMLPFPHANQTEKGIQLCVCRFNRICLTHNPWAMGSDGILAVEGRGVYWRRKLWTKGKLHGLHTPARPTSRQEKPYRAFAGMAKFVQRRRGEDVQEKEGCWKDLRHANLGPIRGKTVAEKIRPSSLWSCVSVGRRRTAGTRLPVPSVDAVLVSSQH